MNLGVSAAQILMKFSEIQQTLKSPKDSRNEFGKYNYRTCSAILEAVKPLLGPATLIVSDELVLIGERYYIKATATYTNKDEGETFTATAYAREPLDKRGMDEAQITGASSTYARKAALSGLFAIDDSSNDPDATNTYGQAPNKPSAGRSRGQTAINQAAAKKPAEGLQSGSGTDAALKTAQQQAKAARQAYINATGADPADVDAALKTVKGATWHTAEGCKIIIDTIAYWQNQGK